MGDRWLYQCRNMRPASSNHLQQSQVTPPIERSISWGIKFVSDWVLVFRWSIPSILSLLVLSACSKTLDSEKIAQNIQQDVIKQGGISLKTVTCPNQVKPEAGSTFECVGEIDTGYTFTIPVKQQDEQGHVTWDVPNSKGLLNLAKFETSIQEAVQSEVGSRPIIGCGNGFKPIKPGQIFECSVRVKEKPKASQTVNGAEGGRNSASVPSLTVKSGKSAKPDAIVVSVGADGNVSWQRVVPGTVSDLLPKPQKPAQPDNKNRPETDSTTPVGSNATKRGATKSAPSQKNAQDFLNQPDASAGFED